MRNILKGIVIGIIITSILMLSMPVFAAPIHKNIKVILNSVKVALNGQATSLSTIVYNDKVYIDAKGLSEKLGKEYTWNKASNTVTINDKVIAITASAAATANTTVEITFSAELDKEAAENIANYNVYERYGTKSPLTVTAAVLDATKKKVTLTTSAQKSATLYGIDITNMKSAAGVPTTVSSITFVGNGNVPQPVTANVTTSTATTVIVAFSAPVDRAAAENISNYKVYEKYGSNMALQVYSAVSNDTGTKVILTTSQQKGSTLYSIDFSNMKNAAGSVIQIGSVVFVGNGSAPQPAAVTSMFAPSNTSLEVTFDTELNAATAENVYNYMINETYGTKAPLTVTAAVLDATNKKVILTTAPQREVLYTIGFANMKNTMGTNLVIEAKTFVGKPVEMYTATAASTSNTNVEVVFSKALDRSAAENPANYSVYESYGTKTPLAVSSVTLDQTGTKATLTTAPQKGATLYNISFNNMRSAFGSTAIIGMATFTGTQSGYDGTETPCAIRVTTISNTVVEVVFDTVLDRTTAENIANYNLNEMYGTKAALMVTAAVLDESGTKVTLTTASQRGSTLYSIGIGGMKSAEGKYLLINPYAFVGMYPVVIDTRIPCNAAIIATSSTSIEISFDKALDRATAENLANYKVHETYGARAALAINSAVLDASGTKVILGVSGQKGATLYSVDFVFIKDAEGNELAIKSQSFVGTP